VYVFGVLAVEGGLGGGVVGGGGRWVGASGGWGGGGGGRCGVGSFGGGGVLPGGLSFLVGVPVDERTVWLLPLGGVL